MPPGAFLVLALLTIFQNKATLNAAKKAAEKEAKEKEVSK